MRAPLADPHAAPDEALVPAVDALLRIVVRALLASEAEAAGEEAAAAEVEAALGATAASISAAGASDKCVASLAYLRDRIGVPRDMSFPAARQLRTRINWAISGLAK